MAMLTGISIVSGVGVSLVLVGLGVIVSVVLFVTGIIIIAACVCS